MNPSAAPPLHVCEGHDGHKDEQIVHDLGAVDRPGVACATLRDERRVQAVLAGRISKRTVRAVAGHVHAFHRRDRSSRRRWTILPALLRILPGLTPLAAAGLLIDMVAATIYTLTYFGPAMVLITLLAGALCAFVAYGRWRVAPVARRMHPTPALEGT